MKRYLALFLDSWDAWSVIGTFFVFVVVYKSFLTFYRRVILKPRDVLTYGAWVVITGTTSGIGRSFVESLAKTGMSVLLISRSESKLLQQKDRLLALYPTISIEYLVFDFSQTGEPRDQFCKSLVKVCERIHNQGGIGLLINNVGTANEVPRSLDEFSEDEQLEILNCNVQSMLIMTKCVLKFMKQRRNGAIINISSGSGNHCGPFIALYSSTKAFMTQFSRSMSIECKNDNIDFLVVTPFYVVSNLFKRKTGTLIAPMPEKLVQGVFAQLGKKQVYQGHGYWFHGVSLISRVYFDFYSF